MFVSAKALDVTYPPIPPKAPSQVQDLALKTLSTEEKKTVSFNNALALFLIPTRIECLTEGISADIWWDPTDLDTIKKSALNTIQIAKKNLPNNPSIREVIDHLCESDPQTISNTQTNITTSKQPEEDS